jgi:hypothetical protein
MCCQIITTGSHVQLSNSNILLGYLPKIETGLTIYSLCEYTYIYIYDHVIGHESHREGENRNFICVEIFRANLSERVRTGTNLG